MNVELGYKLVHTIAVGYGYHLLLTESINL